MQSHPHFRTLRPRPTAGRAGRRRDERGNSLVEVLLALALIGILLLGVIAGFQTTATTADSSGRIADQQAALAVVADRVAAGRFPTCATPSALTATFDAAAMFDDVESDGFEVRITDVTAVVPAGVCSSVTSAQLVTIEVTDPRTKGRTVTGQVVIRNRAARAPA